MAEPLLCRCELVDVSTRTEIRYMRGRSDGCPIHETADDRAQRLAREAEQDAHRAQVDAAMRAARETP